MRETDSYSLAGAVLLYAIVINTKRIHNLGNMFMSSGGRYCLERLFRYLASEFVCQRQFLLVVPFRWVS